MRVLSDDTITKGTLDSPANSTTSSTDLAAITVKKSEEPAKTVTEKSEPRSYTTTTTSKLITETNSPPKVAPKVAPKPAPKSRAYDSVKVVDTPSPVVSKDAAVKEEVKSTASAGELIDVEMEIGSVGLGFCIAGGKNSPLGDTPITVKRLFKGKTLKVL